MDESNISLGFSESIDIDQELGYEVPDLHHDLVDIVPFEVDLRFEFDAPQYYDFLEEMRQNLDVKQSAEEPSDDEWFNEHHIHHEAQKLSAEATAPARRRYRIISRPDESSASIEKLLAEHNRKIREDNMLRVKSRKAELESVVNSPTKGSQISKRQPSNQMMLSPQRKCSSRRSIAAPSSSDSPRKSNLSRRSVIVSSATSGSPRRSRMLRKSAIVALPPINHHCRSAFSREPTEITSSGPGLPPRTPLLRKSIIVPEPKEIKLRARDTNAVSTFQNDDESKQCIQNALAKKRTRVEVSICPPDAKSSKTNADNNIPIVKRPRSGKENIDDIAEMLAVHNKKFKTKASYVPRQHSTRDVRLWEKATGKLWYDLSPEERQVANQEISEMKNEQKSNIKQTVQDGLGYVRFPR